MAEVLKLSLFAVLLIFFWSVGLLANYQAQHERLTALFFFAIVLLGAIWLLGLLFALLAAISLYSPENNSRANISFFRYKAIWNPSKVHVLGYATMSYGTTIYAFSIIFLIISTLDRHAFTPTIDSLGAAAYFSIVTIASVGYGDIQPVSGWARFVASAEILMEVAYSVFFFSVIAGFLRERTTTRR